MMTRDMEFRSNHSYTGAFFRAGSMSKSKPVPILYLDDSTRRDIQRWFDRYRLQAVVVANAGQVKNFLLPALGLRRCADTAVACLDYEAESKVAGMDQRFEIIGSHAIDALVAQIPPQRTRAAGKPDQQHGRGTLDGAGRTLSVREVEVFKNSPSGGGTISPAKHRRLPSHSRARSPALQFFPSWSHGSPTVVFSNQDALRFRGRALLSVCCWRKNAASPVVPPYPGGAF